VLHRLGLEGDAQRLAMNAMLFDTVAGIRQIKSYTYEDGQQERFNTTSRGLRAVQLRMMSAAAVYGPLMSFLGSTGLVILLAVGSAWCVEETLSLISQIKSLREAIAALRLQLKTIAVEKARAQLSEKAAALQAASAARSMQLSSQGSLSSAAGGRGGAGAGGAAGGGPPRSAAAMLGSIPPPASARRSSASSPGRRARSKTGASRPVARGATTLKNGWPMTCGPARNTGRNSA
jgi:ABC-type multidrug transport system fused ATPase/permease subunit